MSQYVLQEKDWKLFRERIAQWQEKYIEKLIGEYITLLQSNGSSAKRFWALEQRIREDQNDAGVLVEMRRSSMRSSLIRLLEEGAVTKEDLSDFSQELRDSLAFAM